jgi:hypothetical protein
MQPLAEVELGSKDVRTLLELKRRRARRAKKRAFLAADYFHRPGAFIRECINWPPGQGPYPYQPPVLETLHRDHRVALRGPRGATKTTIAAFTLLHFAITREMAGMDWKIGTTAGSNRQLVQFLWPEVKKWSMRLRWDIIGRDPFTKFELFSKALTLRHGRAYGGATKDSDLIEGLHADEVLMIFDESKAIADEIFDASEGAFQTGNAYVLALSTPGDPTGRFYDIFARKPGLLDWTPLAITLRDCIQAGQIKLKDVKQALRRWGRDSRLFESQLLGIFPTKSVDALIPLHWIELANERWYEWRQTVIAAGMDKLTPAELVAAGLLSPMDALGSDVCTGGRDSALLAPRHDWIIPEIEVGPSDPTRLAYRMISLLKTAPGSTAIVDSQTVGAGVPTLIEDEGIPCIAFNGGRGTKFRDISGKLEFADTRSAAWWNVRDLLNPANEFPLALPVFELDHHLSLSGDLAAPRFWYVGGGKIKIESKNAGSEEMGGGLRKRLKRSTDAGDTVVEALWPGEPEPNPDQWWVAGAGEVVSGVG